MTFADAIDSYDQHLVEKGNKPRSIKNTMGRLRGWFPLERTIGGYSDNDAQKQLDKRVAQVAVDTWRNEIAEGKTFCNWLLKQGKLKRNPLSALVIPEVKRNKGKEQYKRSEAMDFSRAALEVGGEQGTAALLALWASLRASEIVTLKVSDVDSLGSDVWLYVGEVARKTDSARRTLKGLPGPLVELLRELIAGKSAGDWLFPADSSSGHRGLTWLRKLCKRIADRAGIVYRCPHSLRGAGASLARSSGATVQAVAQTLGHSTARITVENYISKSENFGAERKEVFQTIEEMLRCEEENVVQAKKKYPVPQPDLLN